MSQYPNPQEATVGFYNYSGEREQEFQDRRSKNYNYNLGPIVNDFKRFRDDATPSEAHNRFNQIKDGLGVIFKTTVNLPAIVGNLAAGAINSIGSGIDYVCKKSAQGLHFVGDQWDKNVVEKLANAGHNSESNFMTRGVARIAAGVLSPVSAIPHIAGSAISKVGDVVHNASGVVASVPRIVGCAASSILTLGTNEPGYTIPAIKNMAEQIKATGRNTVQLFTEPVHNLGSAMRVTANAFDTPIISQSLRFAGTITQSASMAVEGTLRGKPIRSLEAIYKNIKEGYDASDKELDANSLQDLQKKHRPEGFVKLDNFKNEKQTYNQHVAQQYPLSYSAQPVSNSYQIPPNIKTFDQAQQAFQQQITEKKLEPFKIAESKFDKAGNGTVVYYPPGGPNDSAHQVTYKYENGKLTDMIPGKSVSCVLPPIQKENGKRFEWNNVVNGNKTSMSVNNAQQYVQPEITRPNTPNVAQVRNLSQVNR